ncbi:type II secretion system protein [Deinococcus metalli]|uniref:Prepilin-type N-terminal cleavage/methylation domain-containing protein n=1 Tax=Deinococcus metalli TaxID=1141878 RepID=A0ABQ3JS97_9DEIO|nr:type II secretion system protein [Deinococcus metalli]GHF49901.1 hypothetical protein GCM10017781_27920 [Deinococcus metalli]
MTQSAISGFTLIELLIVIAVIGILAVVMMPAMVQARAKANDSAAATVARQVATTAAAVQISGNAYPSCSYSSSIAVITAGSQSESVKVGPLVTNVACTYNSGASSLDVTVSYSGGTRSSVTTTIE